MCKESGIKNPVCDEERMKGTVIDRTLKSVTIIIDETLPSGLSPQKYN